MFWVSENLGLLRYDVFFQREWSSDESWRTVDIKIFSDQEESQLP